MFVEVSLPPFDIPATAGLVVPGLLQTTQFGKTHSSFRILFELQLLHVVNTQVESCI